MKLTVKRGELCEWTTLQGCYRTSKTSNDPDDSGDYVKTRFQRNLSFLINSEFAYLNFAVLVDWNVTLM